MKTSWYDAAKIWWSFLWRNVLIVVPSCLLAGFVLGDSLDVPIGDLKVYASILGYILTFTLPIITMKWLLNKQIINVKNKE
jgi:membrane protein DedA with SNARE-associated domain